MTAFCPEAHAAVAERAARRLPDVNYVERWGRLSRSMKDAIGVLAIKEAFLRFAASEFVGNVVYLDMDGREAADQEANEIADVCRKVIEEEFPDLFGGNPTPEHPEGIDPPWARPMIRDDVTIHIVEADDPDAVELVGLLARMSLSCEEGFSPSAEEDRATVESAIRRAREIQEVAA